MNAFSSPVAINRLPPHDHNIQLPTSCDPPGSHNPPQQRGWIIFGATGHLGRSLALAALSHSDLVTAVGHTQTDTCEQMAATLYPYAFPSLDDRRCPYLGLLCDVRVRGSVDSVFKRSLERWGRYDNVVNCTGYGLIGACEDQGEWDIRGQFEGNFWGVWNIIQASLPYFRERGQEREKKREEGVEDDEQGIGGRYLIFSSTSGALGVPGLGPYCATKYAVEGLVESMLYETACWDVRATLVEPGYVRRDDTPAAGTILNGGPLDHPLGKRNELPSYGHFTILPTPPDSVYDTPNSPALHVKRTVQWMGDRQPTSAVKCAALVWQLGHCRFPPLRLLLGAFAVESVRERMRGITEEIEDWRNLSFPRGNDAEGDEDEDGEGDADMGDNGHKGLNMKFEVDGSEEMGVKIEGETDEKGDHG